MKIAKYVQSLLPSIEKKSVRKNLDDLRAELRDHTLPPFQTSHEMLKRWRFKDRFCQDVDKRFPREVGSKFRGNYVEVTYFILKRTLENIDTFDKMVDEAYAHDVVRSAISYSDTQLLQLIEAISFAVRYARKLLMYTLAQEVDLYRDNNLRGQELTKAETDWLIRNVQVFYLTLRALDKPGKDYLSIFQEIPDIAVDVDNADNVAAMVGSQNLDPLRLGAHGLILNPIYHVRIAWTEWQVARYDSAKEERKMLEFQILDMKNALDNKSDPKLEKALEYTQDRVSRLSYKIQKIEEGE
jgi:hypothetical protein